MAWVHLRPLRSFWRATSPAAMPMPIEALVAEEDRAPTSDPCRVVVRGSLTWGMQGVGGHKGGGVIKEVGGRKGVGGS